VNRHPRNGAISKRHLNSVYGATAKRHLNSVYGATTKRHLNSVYGATAKRHLNSVYGATATKRHLNNVYFSLRNCTPFYTQLEDRNDFLNIRSNFTY